MDSIRPIAAGTGQIRKNGTAEPAKHTAVKREPSDSVDLKNQPLNQVLSPEQMKGFLKAIPKVDLHRHLEGDGGSKKLPETVINICKRRGIKLPTYDPEKLKPHLQVGPEDKTLLDFLKKFDTIGKVFSDRDAVGEMTFESIKAGNKDNVKYMELRFSPTYMASQYGMSEDEVMDGVIDGVKHAKKELDTDVGLIMIVERQRGVEHAKHIEKMAEIYKDQGVVALDLANDEYNFPPDEYAGVFQKAKRAGLKVTVHAAETPRKLEDMPLSLLAKVAEGSSYQSTATVADMEKKGFRVTANEENPTIKAVTSGAYNARVAIEDLGADRIGHGVRIFNDPELVEEVKEKGIPLEMCPTSNVQTGATDSLANHPIKQFYDQGIKVTINTDDPGVSGIDLTDDYVKVVDQFGFSAQDVENFVMNGVESAFLPKDEREAMKVKYKKQINDTFGQFLMAGNNKNQESSQV